MMKRILYILSVCFNLIFTCNVNAQTAAADNKISESVTFKDMPKGPGVYGIFEGRSPCAEISQQLGADMPATLDHLKWQLILYRDSATLKPTTYSLLTEMFERHPLTGKWRIKQGTKNNRTAMVYVLDPGQQKKPIYILKGDENVLFILDDNFEFLTGDRYFSYTLNRVNKVKKMSSQ